MQLNYKD